MKLFNLKFIQGNATLQRLFLLRLTENLCPNQHFPLFLSLSLISSSLLHALCFPFLPASSCKYNFCVDALSVSACGIKSTRKRCPA